MSSACTQLCLRFRGLSLSCRTYIQVQHYIRAANTHKSIDGYFTKNHNSTQTRLLWKPQTQYYNGMTAKYLTTEAEENKYPEGLSGIPILMPASNASQVTENQIYFDLDATAECSALEEISDEEAVSIPVPPSIPPASTSLSDYVDKSETLTRLVQLGVNLWKLEQRPNVGTMLLKLDFNKDVVPRVLFLKEIGVENSRVGYIITHNPFILSEEVENLQARVNYLKSRKFSSETIASMISRAPYLLNFSVKRLDNRLGFYQQQIKLSSANTRDIVARLPRLLCSSLEPVKENLKVCKIELGFKENEIQYIVIAVPKVLTTNKMKLTKIFDLLHNTMKVPHHLIAKFPQVLNSKYLRLRERHFFLEYLGKAQYDPNLPNYISLDRLVSLPDETFCNELALATPEDFYLFQKTL